MPKASRQSARPVRVAFPAPRDRVLTVGEFTLSSPAPGKVWITNSEGEGMETTEDKLAARLAEFFEAEF